MAPGKVYLAVYESLKNSYLKKIFVTYINNKTFVGNVNPSATLYKDKVPWEWSWLTTLLTSYFFYLQLILDIPKVIAKDWSKYSDIIAIESVSYIVPTETVTSRIGYIQKLSPFTCRNGGIKRFF